MSVNIHIHRVEDVEVSVNVCPPMSALFDSVNSLSSKLPEPETWAIDLRVLLDEHRESAITLFTTQPEVAEQFRKMATFRRENLDV